MKKLILISTLAFGVAGNATSPVAPETYSEIPSLSQGDGKNGPDHRETFTQAKHRGMFTQIGVTFHVEGKKAPFAVPEIDLRQLSFIEGKIHVKASTCHLVGQKVDDAAIGSGGFASKSLHMRHIRRGLFKNMLSYAGSDCPEHATPESFTSSISQINSEKPFTFRLNVGLTQSDLDGNRLDAGEWRLPLYKRSDSTHKTDEDVMAHLFGNIVYLNQAKGGHVGREKLVTPGKGLLRITPKGNRVWIAFIPHKIIPHAGNIEKCLENKEGRNISDCLVLTSSAEYIASAA